MSCLVAGGLVVLVLWLLLGFGCFWCRFSCKLFCIAVYCCLVVDLFLVLLDVCVALLLLIVLLLNSVDIVRNTFL